MSRELMSYGELMSGGTNVLDSAHWVIHLVSLEAGLGIPYGVGYGVIHGPRGQSTSVISLIKCLRVLSLKINYLCQHSKVTLHTTWSSPSGIWSIRLNNVLFFWDAANPPWWAFAKVLFYSTLTIAGALPFNCKCFVIRNFLTNIR